MPEHDVFIPTHSLALEQSVPAINPPIPPEKQNNCDESDTEQVPKRGEYKLMNE